MEVPTVATSAAPVGAPTPAPAACVDDGPSFDEALANANANLDAEAAISSGALAALLTLAAPLIPANPQPAAAPALQLSESGTVVPDHFSARPPAAADNGHSLNWAPSGMITPTAAASSQWESPAEGIMLPAPQTVAIDETVAGLRPAGAPSQAEPDVQPPEVEIETAAAGRGRLPELDDTPILQHQAPPHEPARLTEARPNPSQIPMPESTVLVQVEHALGSLGERAHSASTPTAVRVQLQPESLGRLELHLAHGEQGLRVTLTAENVATGQLLERRLDDLRQTLVASGVTVSSLSVSVESGQPEARPFLRQRPALSVSAVPARTFSADEGSAYIRITAQRTALSGVDYRI